MKHAILALELSSDPSSVALAVDQNGTVQTWENEMVGGRGCSLLPEIDKLLRQAGLGKTELGAILAGVGPGSYTGLRIACTAARSLSLALGIPCAGVNSFEAAALAAPVGSTLHIFQDAYRLQVYHAIYRRPSPQRLQVVQSPKVISIHDLFKSLPANCQVVCDQRLQETLASFSPTLLRPTATQLLNLAQHAGLQVDGKGIDQLLPAVPLYLRAAAFRQS
jgi:tRNA threonylcarbamoyl adenosine modification protein YeaZ